MLKFSFRKKQADNDTGPEAVKMVKEKKPRKSFNFSFKKKNAKDADLSQGVDVAMPSVSESGAEVNAWQDETPKKSRGLFSRKKKPENVGLPKSLRPPEEKKPKKSFSFLSREKKADDAGPSDSAAPVKEKKPKEKKEKPLKEKKARGAKADVVVKGRKPSFVRQERFTLLIGDEGAILIHMKGRQVFSRQFVPDASEANLAELRETIAKQPLAPVTMVIDSMDQVYVQQTLPPVSSLSVQKLIKRRMDREFKADDIKGAIVLGKEKTGRKDWNFLMISVDKSPQMTLWLDFVMTLENRFRGIVLLSVEAEIFSKNLDRAIGGIKLHPAPEWKFIVSHNKVGGFRQIVLRNGRLIFTRLAQPVGEPTPEVIAGNIEQEILTTIEYLKRMGFDSRNGLDVTIIASEAVVDTIDTRRLDAVRTQLLTPYKVAEYLGIEGATQPTDKFGDVIISAAIGGASRNILKMSTIESRKYDAIQKLKYSQRTFGTFLVLGLVVYAASLGYESLLMDSDIEDLLQKKRISEQNLAVTKQKVEESKLDVDSVMDKIELYKLVKKEHRSPLATLALITSAIKPPIIIKEVNWQFNVPKPGEAPPVPTVTPPLPNAPKLNPAVKQTQEQIIVTLEVDLPPGITSPPMYRKYSEQVEKNIRRALPGYEFSMDEPPPEYRETDSLSMTFDRKGASKVKELGVDPIPMKFTITGPFVESIDGVEAP